MGKASKRRLGKSPSSPSVDLPQELDELLALQATMLDNMKNGNFSSVPMPSSSSNPSDTATHIPTMPHNTKFGDWSFLQHSLLLSDGFIRTAEKVYESQTNNRTRLLIKKIMNLLRDANRHRLSAKQFNTRFDEIEAEWIKIVDGTSFKGRANVGDRVTLETKLLILLHWATPACMKKEGPNKVDTKQGVIITMKRSFPSSLNNEAGEGYLSNEELDALDENITIHDFHPVVPKTKDNHDEELDEVADEIGVTREEYEVLCALLFLCKVTYSSLLKGGERCRVVCGSTIVYSKMFVTSTCGNRGPMKTDWMLDCGELSHPETYCAGYIGNILVFPLLRLDAQCRTLVLAYSSVCHTPVVSRIAYRFGGIDGKSPQELELLAEAMREICVKGGEMSASMLIEATNFVHMCMANDEMSREDAIELLRETCPKHASRYEGCIKGATMATEAAEFVKGIVEYGMEIEEAIELLWETCPTHASIYEGRIGGPAFSFKGQMNILNEAKNGKRDVYDATCNKCGTMRYYVMARKPWRVCVPCKENGIFTKCHNDWTVDPNKITKEIASQLLVQMESMNRKAMTWSSLCHRSAKTTKKRKTSLESAQLSAPTLWGGRQALRDTKETRQFVPPRHPPLAIVQISPMKRPRLSTFTESFNFTAEHVEFASREFDGLFHDVE